MLGWIFRLFYQLGSMERKSVVSETKYEYRWVCPHCDNGNKFEVSSNTASIVERMIDVHKRTAHRQTR